MRILGSSTLKIRIRRGVCDNEIERHREREA